MPTSSGTLHRLLRIRRTLPVDESPRVSSRAMWVSTPLAGQMRPRDLVSCAGLAPVPRLAQRAGLRDLVAERCINPRHWVDV
jgi:hypothetical protein